MHFGRYIYKIVYACTVDCGSVEVSQLTNGDINRHNLLLSWTSKWKVASDSSRTGPEITNTEQ